MSGRRKINASRLAADWINPAVDGVGLFFTRGEGLLSRIICAVTKSRWSHVGLYFHLAEGGAIYYEALAGRGVCGPLPISKLNTWLQAHPDRALRLYDLPGLSSDVLKVKRAIASTYVGTVTYGELQLLALFAWERWGRPVARSTTRVVCCEFVARILAPEFNLCDPSHPTPDHVTPGSVFRRVEALLLNSFVEDEEVLGI